MYVENDDQFLILWQESILETNYPANFDPNIHNA